MKDLEVLSQLNFNDKMLKRARNKSQRKYALREYYQLLERYNVNSAFKYDYESEKWVLRKEVEEKKETENPNIVKITKDELESLVKKEVQLELVKRYVEKNEYSTCKSLKDYMFWEGEK